MELDPVLLSRIQFGFVVSFHIIFPSFTIGLAAWLATIEGMRLATGKPIYRRVFDFWLKIFALSFAMGVVSGIVMAFQFGTNWSVLSERTGSIQGPLLGYESFTAFLLEATFFGVMLLGRDRVPPWFYFLSCCMVSLGTMFSSFWILCNNTWMQVPLGHAVIDGRIVPDDWWAITTGPIVRIRWPHMLLAAFLTSGMSIIATGAWHMLRGRHLAEARVMLRWGLGLVAVLIPLQLWIGHLTGDYVHHYQPAKFAAIEARWQTEQPASRSADRPSRSEGGEEPVRTGGAEARQLHRLGHLGFARSRPRHVPAARPPARHHSLLHLPYHGGHGPDHAGGVLVRRPVALARPAGARALVPVGGVRIVSDRLRRRAAPAGSPPRSAASRGWSTACCGPGRRSRRRSRPARCWSRSRPMSPSMR